MSRLIDEKRGGKSTFPVKSGTAPSSLEVTIWTRDRLSPQTGPRTEQKEAI